MWLNPGVGPSITAHGTYMYNLGLRLCSDLPNKENFYKKSRKKIENNTTHWVWTLPSLNLPFRAISSASMTGHPKSLNILETVLLPVAIPPVKPTINIAVDGQHFCSFYKICPADISAILEVRSKVPGRCAPARSHKLPASRIWLKLWFVIYEVPTVPTFIPSEVSTKSKAT